MSQTLAEAAGWAGSAPILHFINLRETEAEREQPVLLAHGPRAGKAEALAQPQHRLEALDRAPRRVEGLEAANPRHGLLDPEVIALDPLLEMFGDVMGPVAKFWRLRLIEDAGGMSPSEPEVARDPERPCREAEAPVQGRFQGSAL